MRNKIILSFFLCIIVSVSVTYILHTNLKSSIIERVLVYEKLNNTKTNFLITEVDKLMGSDFSETQKYLVNTLNIKILNASECKELFLNKQDRAVFYTVENTTTFEVFLIGQNVEVLEKCERKIFSVIRLMNEELQSYYTNTGRRIIYKRIVDAEGTALSTLKTYLQMYEIYNYKDKEKSAFFNNTFPELEVYIQQYLQKSNPFTDKYIQTLKLQSEGNISEVYFLKLLSKKDAYNKELSTVNRFISIFVISLMVVFMYFYFQESILRKKIKKYFLSMNKTFS